MSRNTNADRARDAGLVFVDSTYAKQDNDALTNLGDFICDLLHYADTLTGQDYEPSGPDDTLGFFVLGRGEWHYRHELEEESDE